MRLLSVGMSLWGRANCADQPVSCLLTGSLLEHLSVGRVDHHEIEPAPGITGAARAVKRTANFRVIDNSETIPARCSPTPAFRQLAKNPVYTHDPGIGSSLGDLPATRKMAQ